MSKMNRIFKQTIYFALILSLLASSLSISAFAAEKDKYYGPSIINVSMNETRSRITLNFDKEIQATTDSLTGKIKLSRGGASLEPLPSDSKITVSSYSISITLSTPLDTSDNYFLINKDTLVNQKIAIESPLFDARGPALSDTLPISIDPTAKTVTIRFKSAVKGYPSDDDLKNGYITLARNGTTFSEVIPANNISFNNSRTDIIITIPEWLGNNNSRIKIAAGKLKLSNGNINLNEIITPALSSRNSSSDSSDSSSTTDNTPKIKSTEISADRRTVTVYFTDKIKNAYASGVSESLANSLIKSHIWISRASTNNYELLTGADSISLGSDNIKITFATPLNDNKNYIKFEKSTFTDANDTPIDEILITGNVTANLPTSSATPEFASLTLPDAYTIVLYFNIPVIKNSGLANTQFLSRITLSRNGGSYKALTVNDKVVFSENSMTIKLTSPITGENNRIKIQADAITSKLGNPLNDVFITDAFKYNPNAETIKITAPEYSKATYDKSLNRITIYFKNKIKLVSGTSLYSNISISRNSTSFKTLSSADNASVSPQNAISITLSEPLTGARNAVKIAANTIADYETGYVLNDIITTDYIDADSSDSESDSTEDDVLSQDTAVDNSTTETITYADALKTSVSDDFYTVAVKFTNQIYNNLNSLQQLKSNVFISKNGSFVSLGADDYIRVDNENKELVIVLAKPEYDYFSQIKILPNALREADGNTISETIISAPLGESDGIARLYLNDSAVIGGVSSQISGDSVIATISKENTVTSLTTKTDVLVKLPVSKSKATLNISKNVADSIKRIGGTIALSYGNTTYYLPSDSIPSLSDGDVVSLSIDNGISTTALSSAASKDAFSIEVPAANLSALLVSGNGESKNISHNVFAKKRFMVQATTKTPAFSSVRIENSGMVVPLPSTRSNKNGYIYITSNTLTDGKYAAVSANHTFANTPSWVETPANKLGSLLILTNASGSDLKANQTISRSETVSIMSRTLGILADSTGASPFFDMVSTDSFFNAVMSSVSNKLISGYPDGTFKPNGTLTRAEAMTIVARAMRFIQGKSVSASSDMTLDEANSILSKFTDNANVDNWAKIDIAECVKLGVVNGDNKGRLNPKSNVTRAELIQLMYNILNKSNML